MIDIISFLTFLLYLQITLLTLLFVSPIISVVVMVAIPFAAVYFLPEKTIQFLSLNQFSFANGQVIIQNIHILLLIWSALIGVVVYTEFISWYLFKGRSQKPEKLPAPPKSDEPPQPVKNRAGDFLAELGTIMSGRR